jgi:hypothetical protein
VPKLSIWMVRSALLHLVIGFAIGAAIMWQKGPGGMPEAWRWLPVHIHMLLIGWIVQLAIGVAYWILPRFTSRDEVTGRFEQARGRDALAWASFILLNTSTASALVVLTGWPWAIPASALLAASAALAFTLHAWPRVKPFMATPETDAPG